MAGQEPHCQGKLAWPELLGAEPHAAKETIEKENPYVRVHFIAKGQFRTHDYRCDRVFVWTSENNARGTVIQIPTVG